MSNAANHAKQNIVKYHSVVGVTEDIPGFRTLLEYMHPHYFEGITQYPISKYSCLFCILHQSRLLFREGQRRPILVKVQSALP